MILNAASKAKARLRLLVSAVLLTLALAALAHVLMPRSLADSVHESAFHWARPAWAPTPLVPAANPMSDAKVALGRELFYDQRLSVNGSLSCASCHEQRRAFTDGQKVHLGATGVLGRRNVMGLANVAYFPTFTWANSLLTSLEKQMQVPLFSDQPLEMGMAGHDVQLVAGFENDPKYKQEFRDAFPDENGSITMTRIIEAISAFERTLLSFDSPYDRYKHGDAQAISPAAKRGEALFFGERLECYHCHGGVNFTDNNIQVGQPFPEKGFHNTGLYNEDGKGAYKATDHGLRETTSSEEDEGAFRTPSLRNVAVTAPYMHDGSIATLDDVIRKHYAVKGRAALGRHGANPLRSEFIEGFSINDREVADLIAFLRSLTDEGFLTNPAFSNPHLQSPALGQATEIATKRKSNQ